MKKLFLFFILIFYTTILPAESFGINEGRDNASRYIEAIANSIASKLSNDRNSNAIKAKTLVILSIVDINNYKRTSQLGRRLSEELIHAMESYGYKILDYKASDAISIDKSGEYLFSRAMKDLKGQRRITYALSGTYTRYADSLSINCRIIDIKTSIVVSTAKISIPRAILRKIEKKRTNTDPWFSNH